MIKPRVLKTREDWLQLRKNYIGGSDASSVLGLNPYKTNVELWEEKTGQKEPEDISDKPYVRYGTVAEHHLRELFRLDFPDYKLDYAENNIWLNPAYPWAHASLDGWITDKDGRLGILEIKTTNILQSMQKERWNDRIPDNYYVQVLHYMAVTGAEFAVLKAQLKTDFGMPYLQTKHYMIERSDAAGDMAYLMDEERRFWELVKQKKRPHTVLPEI